MEPIKVQFNKNSEERRKRRTKFLFVALLAFTILTAGTVAFLRRSDFQVTDVQVRGVQALDSNDILRQAHADFSGYYLWVIPKSNILLFSKRALRERLMQEFPGIDSLIVSFNTRNAITITVTEKEPTDVWCRTTDDCYFIDPTGMIYRQAPVFSDGIYIVFSGSTLELPSNIIRARFISEQDFTTTKKIVADLKEYPISVLGVHSEDTGDISLRIENIKGHKLSTATKLLVTIATNQQSIIQNLDLLMADKGFTNALVSRGHELEVIDFRFPGKIYYKFKNGNSIPAAYLTPTTLQ